MSDRPPPHPKGTPKGASATLANGFRRCAGSQGR
jgi:hypothetical protein